MDRGNRRDDKVLNVDVVIVNTGQKRKVHVKKKGKRWKRFNELGTWGFLLMR